MSAEENKVLVRRFYEEVWNQGNLDVADELFATDYVCHNAAALERSLGALGLKRLVVRCRTAFPHLQFTVEDLIAENDRVTVRWTVRGLHRVKRRAILPQSKKSMATGVTVYRMTQGKIMEAWVTWNMLGAAPQH